MFSDNTTAISYVKNMGGMSSELRDKIAADIWNFVLSQNMWISITHIPGVQNVEADWASRTLNERTEWSLFPTVFQFLCQTLGSPVIDLFASRLNHQINDYFSWIPDPFAKHIDTFTVGLSPNKLYYAFPPFSLIARFLKKIKEDQIETILVFPFWPSQSWFPVLLNMLISPVVILRNDPLPLYLPWDPTRFHPLSAHHRKTSLTLLSARVSGNIVSVRAFHDQQRYWRQGDFHISRLSDIHQLLKNGSHFVHRDRLFPLIRH